MDIAHEGFRKRYFHERAKVEAQAGNPLHKEVTPEARQRLLREIEARAWFKDEFDQRVAFGRDIEGRFERVFGVPGPQLTVRAVQMPIDEFLGVLEIALESLWLFRKNLLDIVELQSILADDLSAFRIRNVGREDFPDWQLQPIDNAHLHTEIVDRTFELTRIQEFAPAQRDYAEAWKHFSKGDFDDALVNAHKAFESAAKVTVKRMDPATTPDNLQTNQLAQLLARLDILPARLQAILNALIQIFTSAGTLRNAPGAAHGSLDLTGPEASVTLLGLRISGTLICFLAERWK